VLTSLHRKLITENFGDFEKSFNIGNIDGGFGAQPKAADGPHTKTPSGTPAQPKAADGTHTKTPSGTPSSGTSVQQRTKKRVVLFSPKEANTKSARFDNMQRAADEFCQLSSTRKKLMREIEKEPEESDERLLLTDMLQKVQTRRKELAASSNVEAEAS
jgi:hypothetical protein